MKFAAVAFDLDGTLYPDFRLFLRLIPFIIKENRLLLAMGKARKKLRNSGSYEGDFYETQARLMAEILERSAQEIKELTERLIYRGWEQHFKKIKLFPHIKETLELFRSKGLKLGLLSDFPPEKKLEYLGLNKYWDAVVCSEVSGRLKPDPLPFLDLARNMDIEPGQILYVGNSLSYDVAGAGSAGMSTALIQRFRKKNPAGVKPDFIFHDYRKLQKYVLG